MELYNNNNVTIPYDSIDNPYNQFLEREGQIEANQVPNSNGNVETMPVKSDGSQADIWIKNFIKSTNWQPKKVGFYINGQTGYAEFTNVFISGEIQALTGKIGGFNIGATDLSVTSGGNSTIISSGATAFSAGPTGAPTITISQAGVLTASSVSISGSITGSTITGGTITGALIETSSSNNRIEINSSNEILFYASGVIRTSITNGILSFYDPSGVGSGAVEGFGTNELGIDVGGGGDYFFNGTAFYPNTSNTYDLGETPFGIWNNVYCNTIIGTSQIITLGGYTLNMNSTNKTAIVPTLRGFNALYSIESPEVWFVDFVKEDKKLDPLFKEVTIPPYHFLKCENSEYQVWAKRKGHEDLRFEQKSEKEFIANELFLNMNKPLTSN